MSRTLPHPGMPVRIVHLGADEDAVVEEVADGGRVVVAGGRRFALHPLTGRHVLEGSPYFGPRLVMAPRPRGD